MGYLFLAFIIALTATLIFSAGLKSRGPWWLFFVVIFFASWAGALWINPVGPILWGVSWVPMAVIALIFALILAAVASESPPKKEVAGHGVSTNGKTAAIVIGSFFWLLLISLLVAIILGYSY